MSANPFRTKIVRQSVKTVGCRTLWRWPAYQAKAAGLYKKSPENKTRNAAISSLLSNGRSWQEIVDATGYSRTLLAKIARDRRLLKAEPASEENG